MKRCVNSACRAELEDYMERCPECGRTQKQIEVTVEETQTNCAVVKERHGFVTFWLWLIAVGNLLMAIISFFPKFMWGSSFPDAYVVYSIVDGLFGLINVVGAAFLLSWKKLGFAILFVSGICGGLFGLITVGSMPVGLVGLVILWLVLQKKKNGVPYWACMD